MVDIEFGEMLKWLEVVEKTRIDVLNFPGNSGETGGYFSLFVMGADDTEPPAHPVITSKHGVIDPENVQKYHDYSWEKPLRLMKNRGIGHVSSRQSRRPQIRKWGGAIFVEYDGILYFLGYSGASESEDEAIMLISALRMDALDYAAAIEIALVGDDDRPYNDRFFGQRFLLNDAWVKPIKA